MTSLCQDLITGSRHCQNLGRYNGYCEFHRPRILNREYKCAFDHCLNQVANQEYIYCQVHHLYESRLRCYFYEHGARCRNNTYNIFSYCQEHDIFLNEVDNILDNMSWGYSLETRYEYDLDIVLNPNPNTKPKITKIILKQKLENNTCSICLEDFKLNEIYKLKCNHHYHIHCLDKWLENKQTCPLDRSKIE